MNGFLRGTCNRSEGEMEQLSGSSRGLREGLDKRKEVGEVVTVGTGPEWKRVIPFWDWKPYWGVVA